MRKRLSPFVFHGSGVPVAIDHRFQPESNFPPASKPSRIGMGAGESRSIRDQDPPWVPVGTLISAIGLGTLMGSASLVIMVLGLRIDLAVAHPWATLVGVLAAIWWIFRCTVAGRKAIAKSFDVRAFTQTTQVFADRPPGRRSVPWATTGGQHRGKSEPGVQPAWRRGRAAEARRSWWRRILDRLRLRWGQSGHRQDDAVSATRRPRRRPCHVVRDSTLSTRGRRLFQQESTNHDDDWWSPASPPSSSSRSSSEATLRPWAANDDERNRGAADPNFPPIGAPGEPSDQPPVEVRRAADMEIETETDTKNENLKTSGQDLPAGVFPEPVPSESILFRGRYLVVHRHRR